MADGAQLLRLLEPVVRPDGQIGPVRGPQEQALPIEARSFESLLRQAQSMSMDGAAEKVGASGPAGQAQWLAPLVEADRIENESIRGLLVRSAGVGRGNGE